MTYTSINTRRERARLYYANNRERIKGYMRDYKRKHPGINQTKDREKVLKYRKSIKARLLSYTSRCKRNGTEFLLSDLEFSNMTSMPCYYCGDKNEYVGIDRVDNTLGYCLSNTVPCCKWCNTMKLYYSKEEFVEKCKKIANNFRSDSEKEF